MSAFTHDALVFIGRFQPFHQGHRDVIQKALQVAREVLILIGSARQPRSLRNPWTYEERCRMIVDSFAPTEAARLRFAPIRDVLYNDEVWVRNIQTAVQELAAHGRVGLVGHRKDRTSYYLKLFPQWPSVAVETQNPADATRIRRQYFRQEGWPELLPAGTEAFLRAFAGTEAFQELCAEEQFIREYQRGWAASPYPPTFVTVDALVVQSGHVLLVERKARPGKGLWALPGGFVNQEETLLDACLRELREETRLKVPAPVLKGSICAQRVFDDPYRSSRGRTITQVFHMELERQTELPKVKGGDDAQKAFWLPLGELDSLRFFEDHYFIIQALLGLN